jgi:hypothetical protein
MTNGPKNIRRMGVRRMLCIFSVFCDWQIGAAKKLYCKLEKLLKGCGSDKKKSRSNLNQILSVVYPNLKEPESFGWIRIQKKSWDSDMDSDSDPDTVVEWKIAAQTLEREKKYVFLLEILFLWHTGSRTHMKAIRGAVLKKLRSKY